MHASQGGHGLRTTLRCAAEPQMGQTPPDREESTIGRGIGSQLWLGQREGRSPGS